MGLLRRIVLTEVEGRAPSHAQLRSTLGNSAMIELSDIDNDYDNTRLWRKATG